MSQPNGPGSAAPPSAVRIEIVYDPAKVGAELSVSWPRHLPADCVFLLETVKLHILQAKTRTAQAGKILTRDLVFPQPPQ